MSMDISQKTPTTLMVALSVMAVSAAVPRSAGAQTINCAPVMQFGTLASCGVPNTATLAPAGGLTTSGCLTAVGSSVPGHCIITGIVGTTIITVAPGPGNFTNGTSNMVVDNFLLQTSSGAPVASLTGVSPPNIEFDVGATLHVGAAQPGGTYTGIYTITTNYP